MRLGTRLSGLATATIVAAVLAAGAFAQDATAPAAGADTTAPAAGADTAAPAAGADAAAPAAETAPAADTAPATDTTPAAGADTAAPAADTAPAADEAPAAGADAAAPAPAAPVANIVQDQPIVGHPVDGALGFQPAATSIAREQHNLDHLILIIITGIALLVTALLLWCAWRYNEKRNPVPAKFTHNSPLEIAWTVVPILILVVIGSFSLPVLFNQVEMPKGDINLKITGAQWYWSYEYTDEKVAFDSFLLNKEDLAKNGYDESEYLLATDTQVVLPVNKIVAVTVTGADVIHAWYVPAFGVMHSAVPGRLGEFWFKPEKEGIYFGQCTNICGKQHAYMPITVKVVSQEAYDAWLAKAKVDYSADATPVAKTPATVRLASN